jgi:ribosomal protein L11 methyltransferase
MVNSQTFELTIYPGRRRAEVVDYLRSKGIEDFVEAAGEVNADDSDWERAYEDWAASELGPVLIYRQTSEELSGLIIVLTQQFGAKVSGQWIADTVWQEAWEPDFVSLETERFFIAAPSVEGGGGKIRLNIRESRVFGSGQHATTQALIRLLEKEKSFGEGRFLDVGTGTGVLAMVAHHLGFRDLCGTDIEETAIQDAFQNASLNHIPLRLIQGSLPEVYETWDVIVCNILPPTLTDLLQDLKARLAPQGKLYLAGFHEANADRVLKELKRLDLRIDDEYKVRGWIGWSVARV